MKNLYLLLITLATGATVKCQLSLNGIFSDNMVLQRSKSIRIFGEAVPGKTVQVKFLGKTFTGVAKADSGWVVLIPAQKAGGPYKMEVTSGNRKIVLENILLGDVWIASGQSNMEWPLSETENADVVIRSAIYPLIRHLDVPNRVSFSPQKAAVYEGWKTCSPEQAGKFSAVAYYFATELQKDIKVPIGIINSTWGGTVAEAWMGREWLMHHPDFFERAKAQAGNDSGFAAQFRIKRDSLLRTFQPVQRSFANALEANGLAEKLWGTLSSSKNWEEQGLPGFDGVVWYSMQILKPSGLSAGDSVKLYLGTIDDNDETYINGTLIGKTEGWNKERLYNFSSALLDSPVNTILVKITDNGGGGGFYPGAEKPYLQTGTGKSVLPENWRALADTTLFNNGVQPNDILSSLYNGMISPLINYPVKGVIWYQGESNADRAKQYETLFPMLIKNWRASFKDPKLPFYFVQLSSFDPLHKNIDSNSAWAALRYAQAKAASLPFTGMAVTYDIGNRDDIHPRNKKDVGKRLALLALEKTYGYKLESSGPVYDKHKLTRGILEISFSHDKGLYAKGSNYVNGLMLELKDGSLLKVQGSIKGNRLVVEVPEEEKVISIRYAWEDDASEANLYNGAGLPAVPFKIVL